MYAICVLMVIYGFLGRHNILQLHCLLRQRAQAKIDSDSGRSGELTLLSKRVPQNVILIGCRNPSSFRNKKSESVYESVSRWEEMILFN